MTLYSFEIELVTATVEEVLDSLTRMPYQVKASTLGKFVNLTVESDDDDEEIVFQTIQKMLPQGAILRKTTKAPTPVKANSTSEISQKVADENVNSGSSKKRKNII